MYQCTNVVILTLSGTFHMLANMWVTLLLWLAYYHSNWISSSQINNPLPMTIISIMFVLAWWKDFCSYLSHISYMLLASYPMFGQSYKLLVRVLVDFNKGTYCHFPEKLMLQILLVSEWGNASYANHKVSINLNNFTGRWLTSRVKIQYWYYMFHTLVHSVRKLWRRKSLTKINTIVMWNA